MKLDYRLLEIPFEFTFTISRTSNTVARNVIVTLTYEQYGQTYTGLGESVPSKFYDEDADSVVAFYDRVIRDKMLEGLSPFDIQKLEERFDRIPGNRAAKSAIDQAFYDLQGKITGMPIHRLWGLDPERVPGTSYTIGIADLDTVKKKTEVALQRGYSILKVKLGSPNDVELFEAIRALAPDVTMRVDANAAWKADEALEVCRMLAENGVEFVEEPLLLSSPEEDYERLKEESPVPLMADESCHLATDIPKCAKYFHSVNLKHTKTGGLTESLRIIHAARAHGLKIMLGGFGETSLSVTAFAQLAPLVDYADLDGSLLMAEDPYFGIRFEGSRFTLPSGPGFGVSAKPFNASKA